MLIRNEREYALAVERRRENEDYIEQFRASLADAAYTTDEIGASLAPMQAFHAQLVDDIRLYEDARNGKLPEIEDLRFLGKVLVLARVAAGLSQRQLARKLGVSDAVVSRDEHNEYHAIMPDRAQRILEALGVESKLRLRLATDASAVARSTTDSVPAAVPHADTPSPVGEFVYSDSPYVVTWRRAAVAGMGSDLSHSAYTAIRVEAEQDQGLSLRLTIPDSGAHPLLQTEAVRPGILFRYEGGLAIGTEGVGDVAPSGQDLALGELSRSEQRQRGEQTQRSVGSTAERRVYTQAVA